MVRTTRSDRRGLLRAGFVASTALALSARSYGRVLGANDRVRVGLIGYGLIGRRHAVDFAAEPDVAVAAIAETHRGRRDEAVATLRGGIQAYDDFRQLLDRSDLDAVVVSTPDHWHALLTMMACAAGKDVYVEKPVTLFVREGDWMLKSAERHRRVVQVGTQQRSGPHYARARQLIHDGQIGEIVSVRAQAVRNIHPGYGAPVDTAPPAELNYELWLGPAPLRPYNPNRSLYHFRWFWDYSGGQMTNLGQHCLDIVDWFVGVDSCHMVSSIGGRYHLTDNGETPDVQDALFQLDRWTMTWSHRECAAGEKPKFPLVFYGTKGSLAISRSGFVVTPDVEVPIEMTIPKFDGSANDSGTQENLSVERRPRTTGVSDTSGNTLDQFRRHVRNFLDCVKSRAQPVSDLASGVRVANLCHLANLSLRLGRPLNWDSASGQIVGDPEANAQLERPYRAPWDQLTLRE